MMIALSIAGFATLFALFGVVLRPGGKCSENCGACGNSCATANEQDER
jgi:uncharacterized ferredoxin-like protein